MLKHLRNQVLGSNPRRPYTGTQDTCTGDKDSPTCTDNAETDAETDTDHCPCIRACLLEECADIEALSVAYVDRFAPIPRVDIRQMRKRETSRLKFEGEKGVSMNNGNSTV